MTVIYEPRGKAREYSPLACNLYSGCEHGCIYCYAPAATRADYKNFIQAKPRKDILKQVEKDCQNWKGKKDIVLLCFTCDPYQPLETEYRITQKTIYMLNIYGFPVQILTKGGLRAIRDFNLLQKNPDNAFSVTLTLDNPKLSQQWEPKAAPPEERIESLKIAHSMGIKTWVSFEPVIDPDAVYRMIEITHNFVDLYKVGKLNYHPHAKEIDWRHFGLEVKSILNNLQKPYYIKKDLNEFLR